VSIYLEGFSPPALRPDSKAVELARVMAKPVQLTPDESWLARQLPWSEIQKLERSGIDLIAPVKGPESNALIVLGRKRSEEPLHGGRHTSARGRLDRSGPAAVPALPRGTLQIGNHNRARRYGLGL
jgi:hypothetical protein